MDRRSEKRGELDNLPELMNFADCLEKATIETIEDGVMTGDLYLLSTLENKKKVNTVDFLKAVDERLKSFWVNFHITNIKSCSTLRCYSFLIEYYAEKGGAYDNCDR